MSAAAAPASASVPSSAALYLGVVQFFFATTWTVYVIFLPQLAAQAGIEKHWVPWILIADQVVFALADIATGFWIDRVRAGLARFGGWILAASTLSCVAFIAAPFAGASAGLLLAALAVWALTSSALRSPPWALLARYAAAPRLPWLSTLTLSGSAIAAALAPYLGVALRDADPRLPFLLSALTLLATVGGLIFVERRLAGATPPAADPPFDRQAPRARIAVVALFFALFALATGFQVHFALNSAPQYLRFAPAADLQYLMPVFWIGFNVLMFPAAGLVRRVGALPVLAVAGAIGAIATLGAALAASLGMLIAAQLIAGGCWGAANVAAFSAVIGVGRSAREGTLLGSLFAVFALAAFLRIGIVATGMASVPEFKSLAPWLPNLAWAAAALALAGAIVLLARRAKPV
jgi:hypothetical protein